MSRLACPSFFALLILTSTGCVVLGPLSPLRPLERSLVFQRQTAGVVRVPLSENVIEARFMADDGTHLHGLFFDHPQPRAVVLFCHGNTGTVVEWSEEVQLLRDRHGLAVLVFDYRGYGLSNGTPSEQGILRDARAARKWLAEQKEVHESDIVLMGRSLGGAVAVDLAAEENARGLVLQSTFSSLPDVAAHHMPWLAPQWNMTQRLHSAKKVGRYRGPLLQSHGDADRTIPLASARKLFEAAHEPKEFVVIAGANHNDPQSDEYHRTLDQFIGSLPPVRIVDQGANRVPRETGQSRGLR